ncbi:lactonase family protein [Vibrio rumoiensis]|uniref:6-phosphogluconolactonase n=1 Tax=Vibrio rumoiensis 1S-45 TaxID=1188252 RepID=A0A1E5E3A1_9VIBR|nr:beta-propeller fold lactonase family protein [Vibrio rumoiensis]OEF26263.1 hypothetical protein A1QC_06830 [Vibrio rumoiensis 1S-45]
MDAISLLVSGYTPNNESTGVYQAILNTQNGHVSLVPTDIELTNPSYFDAVGKNITIISEVSEAQSPQIAQYSLSNHRVLSSSNLTGDAPCYVSVNQTHRLITTAQYGSGHIDIFECDESLMITNKIQTIDSQNLDAIQTPSHAHQAFILEHSKTLVSVDLGHDKVVFYPSSPTEALFSTDNRQAIQLPPSSGPRHMVFNHNEDIALVLCEISEQLVTLKKNNGEWKISRSQAAFPNTLNGQAGGAIKLSPDHQFVYLTGRKQNIISYFKFDDLTGDLNYLNAIDCGGDFPRDFAISPCGEWLVVANQNSHNLTSFRRNVINGELMTTNQSIAMTAPVCVAFQDN